MGEPQWNLFPVQGIDKLPSIQWKLLNIKKLGREQHVKLIDRLKSILEL